VLFFACKTTHISHTSSADDAENSTANNPTATAALEQNFISAVGEFPSDHSVTLAELPGKKLIACWYAGEREGAEDVEIYCKTQRLDSKVWDSRVTAVARGEETKGDVLTNNTVGNPVLYFNAKDQILYLFYVIRTFGGWTLSEVAFKSSLDYGQTWGRGKILETRTERRPGGKLTRSLPLELEPGRILLPLYYELSFTKYFRKAGYTCQLDLSHGKVAKNSCQDIPGGGHLQPTLVQVGGTVFAYLRSGNPESRIEAATMNLAGGFSEKSEWKKAANLSLPNPNSSVAAARTSDGKILLAYNSAGGRSVLNLAISDDGQSFRELTKFEDGTGEIPASEYSYPTLFQDSDKVFHLAYTHKRTAIKHIKFTEQWVRSIDSDKGP
jgi:predicted neuraminidase